MAEVFADVDKFNQQLLADNSLVFGGGLTPASSATVVDATGEQTLVTDGPHLETREYLGGFWVVKAADHDAALALAEHASRACRGRVEVRPFQDEADD